MRGAGRLAFVIRHSAFGIHTARHPIPLCIRADESRGVRIVNVAQVIPARAGPLRHGVQFARGGGGILHPVLRLRERRFGRAGGFEIGKLRRDDGQFALGDAA